MNFKDGKGGEGNEFISVSIVVCMEMLKKALETVHYIVQCTEVM